MSFVTMDSLERIKYIIPDMLSDHEAYGYSWNLWTSDDIDKSEPDKRYVGYKGEPWNGTYAHSSDLELFREDLRSSKRVEFGLEFWGYKKDAANWEDEFLSEHKARSLESMYNRTNHGQHASSDRHVNELYDDYIAGNLDKYNEEVDLKYLIELHQRGYRVQARYFDDKEHEKSITAQINSNMGNTDVCKAVTYRDYYGPDIDKIVNGHHTILGAANTDIFKKDPSLKITVCRIPKTRWDKLKETDDVTFGQKLNPRSKFRTKETSELDVIKGMKRRKHLDIEFDSVQNIKLYSGPGYEYTHTEINKIAEKAAKEYRKEDKSSKGAKLADPAAHHNIKAKREKIEKLKKNPHTIVVGITTGNFKWSDIWYEIITQRKEKPEAVEVILVVTYSLPGLKDTAVQDWENKKQQEIHKTLWKEVETIYGLTIKEDPMPRFEHDGSI